MRAPDGRTPQRVARNNVMKLVLLGMVPLFASGVSGMHRHEVDGHAFLRNGSQQAGNSGHASSRGLQGGGLCRNGLPGVGSSDGKGDVCCVAECGVCGGVDCSVTAATAGLTADDCCVSAIEDHGSLCAVTNSAPCIIESNNDEEESAPVPTTTDKVCSNGVPGVESENGDVCCVAECGLCGGKDCSNFGGGLGASSCCVGAIAEEGEMCSTTGTAPCLISADAAPMPMPAYDYHGCYMMGDGEDPFFLDKEFDDLTLSLCYSTCAGQGALYFGVHEGKVCSCGDDETFFTSEDKKEGTCDVPCPGDADELCGGSSGYNLYEVIVSTTFGDSNDSSDNKELPTCSSGIIGVESASGDVCCGYRCGTCGGDRCVGWGDCCEHTIQAEAEMCDDTNTAPCIYNKVAPAPTPTPEVVPPTGPREIPYCTGGIPGVESDDGAICCWEGCGECLGLSTMDSQCVGVYDCCESKILKDGVSCSDVDAGPCVLTPGASPSEATETTVTATPSPVAPTPPTDTDESETTPYCSNGYPGVESAAGDACCPAACSECGGDKCVGYGDCCEVKVHDSGVLCTDDGVEAGPCILIEDSNTGYTYDGCWAADSDFDPFDSLRIMDDLTPERCANLCGFAGSLYMGVMEGNLCGCGSDADYMASDKERGTCETLCADVSERTQTCGGDGMIELFPLIHHKDL